MKAHVLLDLRGNLPTFIHITDGTVHDVNALDVLPIEPGHLLHHGSRVHRFSETP